MLAIDPKHDLFLGIAKHHLKNIWITSGLITDAHFSVVQDHIDSFFRPVKGRSEIIIEDK